MSAPSTTWDALLEGELQTARAPLSPALVNRLAALYAELGMKEAGLDIVTRAPRFGVPREAVLPALLRAFRHHNLLGELAKAARTTSTMPNRSPALRKELALALSMLGQHAAAAQEWLAVVAQGGMAAADWLPLACFIRRHGDCLPLGAAVRAAAPKCPSEASRSLARYCVLRSLMELDPAAAPPVLWQLDPSDIDDAEILLDIAVIAWRLGNYAKAEAAARRASAAHETPPLIGSILQTIQSFSDGNRHTQVTRRVRGSAERLVRDIGRRVGPRGTVWGALNRRGIAIVTAGCRSWSADHDLTVGTTGDTVATFSVLAETPLADPLRVLIAVDWSWPHLMLQRTATQHTLHVFTEDMTRRDWFWKEALETDDAPGGGHGGDDQGSPPALWLDAVQELRQRGKVQQ